MKQINNYGGMLVTLALYVGCAAGGLESIGEEEELGTLEQGFVTRSSAVGGRTWGVKTTSSHRDSCTKTDTSQVCHFVASYRFGLFEDTNQVFKICIVPTFDIGEGSGSGGPGNYWEAVDTVDSWVTSMYVATQGAQHIGWSFSRVIPPNSGSSCEGSGANIVVRPGVTTAPFTSAYGQYATASFVGCGLAMPEVGTVNGTYKACASANIDFAPNQLTTYTLAQGYTAFQRKTKRQEALSHALLSAIGIGAQTNNPGYDSHRTMTAASNFLISNEEICRMKQLDPTGDLFGASYMQISSNTCAN